MQALLWIRIFQASFCYLNHQLMKFMKAHLLLDISKQSTDLTLFIYEFYVMGEKIPLLSIDFIIYLISKRHLHKRQLDN